MSLRKAVNNKCRECIYDPYAKGAWREQVEACTSPACPLFPVRPMSLRRKANGMAVKAVPSTENGRTTEREGVVA